MISSHHMDDPAPVENYPTDFQPSETSIQIIMEQLLVHRSWAVRALYYTGNTDDVNVACLYILENHPKFTGKPLSTSVGDQQTQQEQTMLEDIKMVFVVNQELGMRSGKIASQVAHAAIDLYKQLSVDVSHIQQLQAWEISGCKKIVVTVPTTAALENLSKLSKEKKLPNVITHDAGLTQVASGSSTVVAVFGKSCLVDQVTGTLNLL